MISSSMTEGLTGCGVYEDELRSYNFNLNKATRLHDSEEEGERTSLIKEKLFSSREVELFRALVEIRVQLLHEWTLE
jgi:hypothetical protein